MIQDSLKFVRGAVSRKDIIPGMKHFAILHGEVRAFNGVIALCSPIEFEVDCSPLALPMLKAIDNFAEGEVVSLHLTESMRLRVQNGPFKAYIPCVDMNWIEDIVPDGNDIDVDGDYLFDAVKKIYRFVGDDAARPWTNGILLRGQSAYATNNVCLVQYWLGKDMPNINIPGQALAEMVRIDRAPIRVQANEHSVTFHYDNGCWLRSQLLDTGWPDIDKILDRPSHPLAVPKDLFLALEKIKPFLEPDGRVYFRAGHVQTMDTSVDGAGYAVDGLPEEGVFSHKMLSLLDGIATDIDFSSYPEPLMFHGDKLRGAIIGQRV